MGRTLADLISIYNFAKLVLRVIRYYICLHIIPICIVRVLDVAGENSPFGFVSMYILSCLSHVVNAIVSSFSW